jgi:hypothetical protein
MKKLLEITRKICISKQCLTALCLVAIVSGCDENREQPSNSSMIKSNVVAGPGEKSFEENYNVKLHLPMRESEFVALLDRMRLRYDQSGERSHVIPQPWYRRDLDLLRMEKIYQIYGANDHVRKVAEEYRAYVSKNGEVVYVENMFIHYDAP